MRLRFKHRFLALILILLAISPSLSASKLLPVPKNYVEDRANIIAPATEQQLNMLLKEVEQKTTAQMIILTVETTGEQPIAMFAIDHAEAWKLGQKHKDNGVLVVVATKDKKYRFEIGYGLEGVLTDVFTGSVGRDYMVPNFKRGDFSRGIQEATAAIVNKLGTEYGVTFSGVPKITYQQRGRRRRSRGNPIVSVIGFIIFAVIFFMLPPPLRRLLLISMLLGGRRRGYYGGSGGFGGGGGFSGGGGGSFGGGGATGSW